MPRDENRLVSKQAWVQLFASHSERQSIPTILRKHDHLATSAEIPLSLLDPPITPVGHLLVRYNGHLPDAPFDLETWGFSATGLVSQPLSLTAAELGRRFPVTSITTVIEFAGNGRALNDHPTEGIP